MVARHIGVSEPTLRAHYRELLDNATESMCALVFANLVKTATTKNDNAGVQAAKFIFGCRAGWKEVSKLEIADTGKGVTAILKILREAPLDDDDLTEEAYQTHTPDQARPRH